MIITRQNGEKLIIGDKIKITVLDSSGHTARLGIDADKSIPIYREEIYNKIHAKKEK